MRSLLFRILALFLSCAMAADSFGSAVVQARLAVAPSARSFSALQAHFAEEALTEPVLNTLDSFSPRRTASVDYGVSHRRESKVQRGLATLIVNGAIGRGKAYEERASVKTRKLQDRQVALLAQAIHDIEARVEASGHKMSHEESTKADKVVGRLRTVLERHAFRGFAADIRGREDYLVAFPLNAGINLMDDLFLPSFVSILPEVVFHEGYAAEFGEDTYAAHQQSIQGLPRILFGRNDVGPRLRNYIDNESYRQMAILFLNQLTAVHQKALTQALRNPAITVQSYIDLYREFYLGSSAAMVSDRKSMTPALFRKAKSKGTDRTPTDHERVLIKTVKVILSLTPIESQIHHDKSSEMHLLMTADAIRDAKAAQFGRQAALLAARLMNLSGGLRTAVEQGHQSASPKVRSGPRKRIPTGASISTRINAIKETMDFAMARIPDQEKDPLQKGYRHALQECRDVIESFKFVTGSLDRPAIKNEFLKTIERFQWMIAILPQFFAERSGRQGLESAGQRETTGQIEFETLYVRMILKDVLARSGTQFIWSEGWTGFDPGTQLLVNEDILKALVKELESPEYRASRDTASQTNMIVKKLENALDAQGAPMQLIYSSRQKKSEGKSGTQAQIRVRDNRDYRVYRQRKPMAVARILFRGP